MKWREEQMSFSLIFLSSLSYLNLPPISRKRRKEGIIIRKNGEGDKKEGNEKERGTDGIFSHIPFLSPLSASLPYQGRKERKG